jgi:hypothetical protein
MPHCGHACALQLGVHAANDDPSVRHAHGAAMATPWLRRRAA